ncbi:MAG: SDR family oxidoreductase [Desulfomonilaceae bacterium]
MNSLRNRTLIITGASRGIGQALARELASAGADLVLNARGAADLSRVAGECADMGVKTEYVAGDASTAEAAGKVVEAALKLGGFYGFVHVAGVARPGPFLWELPEVHFSEVFGASVIAAYQLVRFAFPPLLDQGDGIAVFFGSPAAEISMAGLAAYCVAKAAEEHLVRQLAEEAPKITSFVYRPGVVDTGMQREAREAEGGAAETLRREFRGYKEKGLLISPEQAAKGLVKVLTENPRRFHGRIANA